MRLPSIARSWDIRGVRRLIADLREADPQFEFATTPGGLRRGGIFSPEILVSVLLALVADAGRHGYQTVLDDFWEQARAAGIDLPGERAPAAASLCNARQRLRPEVPLALLRCVARRVRARRKGRRFCGVDSSRQHVRRSEDLWTSCRSPANAGSPLVQVSVLFDLDDQIPLHVEVGAYDASERAQCIAHLGELLPRDVLVLDRGYPGFVLLREIRRRRLDFVVRVAGSSTFPAVERFLASGRADADIEIAPSLAFRRSHRRDEHLPLRVRAVRMRSRDGSVTVILTSLPRWEFSASEILRLYRRRWRIEEYFKLVKSEHFGSGQMHAKSFAGVKQEVFAQALFVAITHLLTSAAHGDTPDAVARIHRKDSLHALARCLVELLLSPRSDRLVFLLQRLRARAMRRARPPRPGRSHPRRSFRPCPKWMSTGRRGARGR